MNLLNIVARRSRQASIGALAFAMAVSGCASSGGMFGGGETEGYPKISNTVLQACFGGALVGIAATLLTNKNADAGDILLGAGYGVLAGCAVGAILDSRRQNYASQAEYYDAEIARTQSLNAETAAVNGKLTAVLADNQAQLAQLQTQQASAEADREAAKALRSKAKAELKWAEEQLKRANAELQAQELVLERAEEEAANTERTAALKTRVEELRQTVGTLETQVTELTLVNDSIGQFAA